MKVKKPKTHLKTTKIVENEVDEKDKNEVAEKPLQVDKSIFKYFNDLTNQNEHVRNIAGTQLLQQLSKTKDADKRKKEISYCLKRLVRGVGASTSASRTGFFTTLVAFLQVTTNEDVTIHQVIEAVQKELHVGASISNKEDADAFVGKILVCAAVLRSSRRLSQADAENFEQITNILVQASRHRTYHCSLAYSFIIEMMEKITSDQFEQSVWPLLQAELIKPWPKQTIQTVHCLIAAHLKFPSVVGKKFFKTHFNGPQLLNSESQPHMLRLFVSSTNSDVLIHPALEAFGVYIATCSELVAFLESHFDPFLETPNRLQELISLKILTDILAHLDNEKTPVSRLLTPNFVKMVVTSLKNVKSKNDETLKAFYSEFFEDLSSCCSKATDAERVEVIKKLILNPGTFDIEKFTTNRIVHQIIGLLGEEGVQNIFKTYKDIFLDNLTKNADNNTDTWSNFERQNAAYMLQHLLSLKSVQKSFAWRQEQLQFFMAIGLFNVNNAGEVCARSEAGQLQKDFGMYMKKIFYASLQSKVPAFKEEKAILLSLVGICNEYLQKKKPAKYFRQKINDKVLKAWNDMYAEVHNSKKLHGNEKKLQLAFHILLLHMGLQLFQEPEMAETAILDLEKCMARTKVKKNSSEEDSEPQWIEVVIDLFLHLLSQNDSSLRNIVNMVFPLLCDSLNLTAVHQILAMLDMKDGQNPLSSKNDEDEDDDDEDDEDGNEKDEEKNSNKDDSSEEDEDSEDDEEDEEVEDEEEVTASDKLRNAISLALGSAIAKDDDEVSIDLNDLTEEEGNRLDEALAAAFKAMKKTGGDSQNKKSKSHRVQMTTVMHFRSRVLELLEIYIKYEPSLLIAIEIMLVLFDMLEFCTDEELKPLQIKVVKTLNKLTALRKFGSVQDVTESNIVDFIRLIIDKKARSIAFDVQNELKNKCCMFLIANAKLMSEGGTNDQVLSLLVEYLEDFIKSRNPAVNITLLSDIFKLRWQGVWTLASTLAEKGISMSTRTFRRSQIIDLLRSVYKNNELINQNNKLAKKHLKNIEKIISQHLEAISKDTSISQKEFNSLLEMFVCADLCHKKFTIANSTLSSCTELIQEIRSRLKMETLPIYKRFCNAYAVTPLKDAEQNQNGKTISNGHASGEDAAENEEQNETQADDASASKKPKNKKRKTSVDGVAESFKKCKKLKKEQRLKAFSEGLNGGFDFDSSTAQADIVIPDDSPPN